jgi:hypothetical protein
MKEQDGKNRNGPQPVDVLLVCAMNDSFAQTATLSGTRRP